MKAAAALCTGLLLAGLPARPLDAQAPPRAVTAWEVRRMCSQDPGGQDPRIQGLCALTLPAPGEAAQPDKWSHWGAWIGAPGAGRAIGDDVVRRFDGGRVLLTHVFVELPAARQRAVVAALDGGRTDAAAVVPGLAGPARRELLRAVDPGIRVGDLMDAVPPGVRDELRSAGLRTATREVPVGAFRRLSPAQQDAFWTSVPPAWRVRGEEGGREPALARVFSSRSALDVTAEADRLPADAEAAFERGVLALLPVAELSGALSGEAEAAVLRASLRGMKLSDLFELPALPAELRVALLAGVASPTETVASARARLAPADAAAFDAEVARTTALAGPALTAINTLIPTDRQGAIIAGVGDFVVGRVEEQLQTYFLRSLTRSLCGEPWKPALPATCSVLSEQALSVFQPGLGILRSSVRSDMEALPSALLATTFRKYRDPLKDAGLLPAAQTTMQVSHLFVHTLRGQDPRLALVALADSVFLERSEITFEKAPGAALLAQLAALHLTRVDPTRTSYDQLQGVPELREQLRYMLLALALNTRNGVHELGFTPWQTFPLAEWADAQLGELNRLRAEFATLQHDTTRRRKRAEYAASVLRFVDGALARPELPQSEGLAGARRVTASLRGIGSALAEENYSRTVVEVAALFRQYEGAVKQPAAISGGLRLLGFVSEIAEAPDAATVNATLSRFAGNGTSFLLKRTTPRITVNAFGGLHVGRETVVRRRAAEAEGEGEGEEGEAAEGEEDEVATYAGPYLPVGIDIGLARIPKVGMVGIFLQVVDLGAVASWRFSDDGEAVEEKPELGFAQVFAPGIFGVLHVSGTPLTFGGGWSYTPGLRSGAADADGESRPTFDASRLGLFIAFDVPLFP